MQGMEKSLWQAKVSLALEGCRLDDPEMQRRAEWGLLSVRSSSQTPEGMWLQGGLEGDL